MKGFHCEITVNDRPMIQYGRLSVGCSEWTGYCCRKRVRALVHEAGTRWRGFKKRTKKRVTLRSRGTLCRSPTNHNTENGNTRTSGKEGRVRCYSMIGKEGDFYSARRIQGSTRNLKVQLWFSVGMTTTSVPNCGASHRPRYLCFIFFFSRRGGSRVCVRARAVCMYVCKRARGCDRCGIAR